MTTPTTIEINGVKFSDEDVVNFDAFVPEGDFNPHNVRPWVLHDHGMIVAVVFADSLQDALDEAVDGNKMDRYLVKDGTQDDGVNDLADYGPDEDGITRLGNASEPFDIETLGYFELKNPAPATFVELLKIAELREAKTAPVKA